MPDAPEKLRCFIAVAVDAEIVRKLRAFQDTLAQTLPLDSIRWTPPEQLHLTLKFLGNVVSPRIAELETAFRSAAEGTRPFTLAAQDFGAFSSLRHPRVLWVGLSGETEPLCGLQKRLDEATSPWAEKNENRPFHPHLTLGRVRENAMPHTRRIGERLQAVSNPDFGSWLVTDVRLMRSRLSPKGSTYTTLVAVPFC
jgi:RNA 2',3'-cyclic 3'-phosphodiesterase